MHWLLLAVLVIIFCFGFVLLFGPPYLPTLKPQIKTALDLLDLKPGQTMLELGCGDGRVLRAAASRGWKVVGYELNPILVVVAYIVTWKYRKQVRIIWGDIWRHDWPEAQGIFVFILQKYTPKLNTKIINTYKKPIKLVSFAFEVIGRDADLMKDGVFLYLYK